MIFKIVCAWCGKEMGEKEYFDQPEIERNVTHSMCKGCLEKEIAGMAQMLTENNGTQEKRS